MIAANRSAYLLYTRQAMKAEKQALVGILGETNAKVLTLALTRTMGRTNAKVPIVPSTTLSLPYNYNLF